RLQHAVTVFAVTVRQHLVGPKSAHYYPGCPVALGVGSDRLRRGSAMGWNEVVESCSSSYRYGSRTSFQFSYPASLRSTVRFRIRPAKLCPPGEPTVQIVHGIGCVPCRLVRPTQIRLTAGSSH